MLESDFQAWLIKELKVIFPGCFVLKNDSSYMPGIPDLLILHKNRWAMLECKKDAKARYQPNQEYYIEVLDGMSFAACIHPENAEVILSELQQALAPRRRARSVVRK